MTNTVLSLQSQSTTCTVSTKKYAEYPLHQAAGLGDTDTVVNSLATAPSNDTSSSSLDAIHQLDSKGRTPLHWAARNGRTDLCRLLIENYKADPNVPSYRDEQKGVTPLELSAWRGHFDTVQLLYELGANLNRINSWGCGIAHWTALCPTFADAAAETAKDACSDNHYDNNSESSAKLQSRESLVTYNLRNMATFLTQHGINWTIPNGHGQTPMHKAAYGGNLPILQYLISHFHFVDDKVDEDGNTAADCAERAGKPNAAKWVRKYASREWRESVKLLGLTAEDSPPPPPPSIHSHDYRSMEQLENQMPGPPSLVEIRRAYIELARTFHPDKAASNETMDSSCSLEPPSSSSSTELLRWLELHSAYSLLRDWWTDPDRYDVTVRQRTRNRNLVECPLLLTNGETQNNNDPMVLPSSDQDEIVLFGIRLHRLLQSPNYRQNGLPLDRLSRLYCKSYPGEILPNHKTHKCKKLVHFIKKHYESICRAEYTQSSYLLWPKDG